MRVLIAAGLIWFTANTAALADGFDGKWTADIPAQGKCNSVSTMEMVVAAGQFQGQIHNPRNVVSFHGTVSSDGSGTLVVNGNAQGTISFGSNHFDATWPNSACQRHAEGSRAPDAATQAAMVQDRQQKQAEYASLIARAKEGDKNVDYAKLRAAAIYGSNWQFYDNKALGLIDQLNAAYKGDDCSSVLDISAQIIEQDFTLARAHELRGDCLEKTDRSTGRIEGNISDALIDSLMDSGDGDSEKTAYVVSTYTEELEALAKRHIQLKARTTEVRGSDGHFYDQIQGISFNGGVYARTVYFNVDSFVAGRQSARVEVQSVAASTH